MPHSKFRRNQEISESPLATVSPSTIELSATTSITPSYSASMTLSYSQYSTSWPAASPTAPQTVSLLASTSSVVSPAVSLLASPSASPAVQWTLDSVSIMLTNKVWLAIFLVIFTVLLCSVSYNIYYLRKEKNRHRIIKERQREHLARLEFNLPVGIRSA